MFYSEITELNHVYHQVKEGNLREALHLVKELENNDYLTPEVTLFCKMAKADLFRLMGKFMESIEICEVLYPLINPQDWAYAYLYWTKCDRMALNLWLDYNLDARNFSNSIEMPEKWLKTEEKDANFLLFICHF